MRALDAVVEDGDGDALAGDALEPSALHVHVQAVPAVQVPHLGEPAKGTRRIQQALVFQSILELMNSCISLF